MHPGVAKKPGKPGRRPQGPFEEKRKTLTTRITDETRTRLEKASRASGRSLAQEVELRLEQSFSVDEALGGKDTHAVLRMFGAVATLIEGRTGKSWRSDWETAVAVQAAWKKLALQVGPREPREIIEAITAPLPEAPSAPVAPSPPPRGLLMSGMSEPPGDSESWRAEEEKWAAYEEERVRHKRKDTAYKKAWAKHTKLLEEWRTRIMGMADLGRETAGGLLPESTGTKGES